jgi:hypothetical protein
MDKTVTWICIPVLTLYCSVSGMILGAFSQFFIMLFDYLVTEKKYSWLAFNEISGGLLGGAISGVSIGVFAAVFFGFSSEYFVGIAPLVIGSVLSAFSVTAGALYRGLWRNVARAFIASLLIISCTTAIAVVILQQVDITAWFFDQTTSPRMTQGGAILGVVIGIAAGVQIGLTLALYRLWEPTEQGDRIRLL